MSFGSTVFLSTILGSTLATSSVAGVAGPGVEADPPALVVRAPTCPGLDAAEVQRLVELELTAVTQEIRAGPPLEVALRCDAASLEIAVDDPVTTKHLARDFPAPPDEPGQERVVALAIAQLFAASWLELLLVDETETAPDADAPPGPAPAAGTSAAAVTAARNVASAKTEKPAQIELMAGAGVRGRSIESRIFAALHTDLEIRGWLTDHLGLIGRVGFDYGQANRQQGQVRGYAVTGGGGLGWKWRPREKIGLGGAGILAGGWARVEGVAGGAGVPIGHNQGATGELTIGAGPRIFHRRLRVDIDAEIGGMLRSPEGLVAREPSVTMGGFYAGATVRLGANLSRRR